MRNACLVIAMFVCLFMRCIFLDDVCKKTFTCGNKDKKMQYTPYFSVFFCISIWCAGMCACESNASISILWHRGPVDHSLTPSTLAHYHPFSLSLCVLTHTISDLSDIIPVCTLHKSPATYVSGADRSEH